MRQIIKNILSPSSSSSTSSQQNRAKSPYPSDSARGPPLRHTKTIEKSYYVNDKGHEPSYYPKVEDENEDEKERGRSRSCSNPSEEGEQEVLFKLGRIAILSPKRGSGKDEGKASGSGTGSEKASGDLGCRRESGTESRSPLQRSKSASRLQKQRPESEKDMKSTKRRMSGSSSKGSSNPVSNPHSPRSSALRNPATRDRGNEAPPVPSIPPQWTQKARMAEGDENGIRVVEGEGRKRSPFITVAQESGRKPFITVGAGVNQASPRAGDKKQGSTPKKEAVQLQPRKEAPEQQEQQVGEPRPYWRGIPYEDYIAREKLKKQQAKDKEKEEKARKKAEKEAEKEAKQRKVRKEQAETRKQQKEAELRLPAKEAQKKINQAKDVEIAKKREKQEAGLREAAKEAEKKLDAAAVIEKKQNEEEDHRAAVKEAQKKVEEINDREKAQREKLERENQARKAEKEHHEALEREKEEVAELARKEAEKEAIRKLNQSRIEEALARATLKTPAVVVTPATLPESVPPSAPAPLTKNNLQALATQFGDTEDGDIGDMARTYVYGMLPKEAIEANKKLKEQLARQAELERQAEEHRKRQEHEKAEELKKRAEAAARAAVNEKRRLMATMAPGNQDAGIGDMQRTYLPAMVAKDVMEANERAKRIAERRT